MTYGPRPTPVLTRLMRQVEIADNGCWIWQGTTSSGYGLIRREDNTNALAHRTAWQLYKGGIPENHQLHHTCENTLCCNPDHMEVLTPKQHKAQHRPTHCKRGHEFTEANTYYVPNGNKRHCIQCMRLRRKRFYEENSK